MGLGEGWWLALGLGLGLGGGVWAAGPDVARQLMYCLAEPTVGEEARPRSLA